MNDKDIHKCAESTIRHRFDQEFSRSVFGSYGDAIGSILYNEKFNIWYADNSEYSTPINFCPFCGTKLPILENND